MLISHLDAAARCRARLLRRHGPGRLKQKIGPHRSGRGDVIALHQHDFIIEQFDDLPLEMHRNVNTGEVPYDRHPGQAPRLDDAEIDDVIAFLGTLTDGYDPATDTADPSRPLAR